MTLEEVLALEEEIGKISQKLYAVKVKELPKELTHDMHGTLKVNLYVLSKRAAKLQHALEMLGK